MAGSIKFLHFIQKFHRIIGIRLSQPEQKIVFALFKRKCVTISISSFKIIIFLIFCTQILFTTVAFLLFDAKSMFDYGLALFIFISTICGIAIYVIFVWQSKNTLKFIENCESFIEKSEYLYNFCILLFIYFFLFCFGRNSINSRI